MTISSGAHNICIVRPDYRAQALHNAVNIVPKSHPEVPHRNTTMPKYGLNVHIGTDRPFSFYVYCAVKRR